MEQDLEKLKYPIGKFQLPALIDQNHIETWISMIEGFPLRLKQEMEGLTEQDMKKTYRPNGWTIEQVVNHCADSHMNSFIRFKLALTEDTPIIKPYFENLWADTPDVKTHARSSLKILEGLHERWASLLKSMTETDWQKNFFHPETRQNVSLKTTAGLYAWHGQHHLAHIINAKKQ